MNSKKYYSGLVNNLRIHSEPQRSQIALSDLVMLAISGPGLGPGEMGPFAKWSNLENLECRTVSLQTGELNGSMSLIERNLDIFYHIFP